MSSHLRTVAKTAKLVPTAITISTKYEKETILTAHDHKQRIGVQKFMIAKKSSFIEI